MDVNEIFYSIEGEGIRAGLPCVFVRFNGCNLRCSYCDTKYAQDKKENNMSISAIVEQVLSYGCPRVTLTGGEPLIQPGIRDLVIALIHKHLEVNIETNGSVKPMDVLGSFAGDQNVIVTMDFKGPSSNAINHMRLANFIGLEDRDVLKFVVGSQEDMEVASTVISALKIQNTEPNIFFSPVFGRIEPKDIVEFLKSRGLTQCRVQLQLHKFIWPPEERGV